MLAELTGRSCVESRSVLVRSVIALRFLEQVQIRAMRDLRVLVAQASHAA